MKGTVLLADHLSAESDAIVTAWRAAVEQSGEVPDATRLTFHEFADHIPSLLDRLAERLRGRPADPAADGEKHGRMRFRQGYDISEVIGELGHLRTTLSDATFDVATRNGLDASMIRAAYSVVNEVLNEATAAAVRHFRRASRADKRAALARAELQRQAILDSVRDYAIFSLDEQGRVATWNRGAERVFGYTEEEIIGRHVGVLFTPEDRAAGIPERQLEATVAAGSAGDDRWLVRKDGSRFFVSGSLTPIRDGSGFVKGFSTVARDITEWKRAEEALREVDRRKDEFLAILSHELRNPIAAIRSAVELARTPGVGDQVSWCHEVIDRQIGQLARLTDDLMDVSRIAQGKIELRREPADLTALVARAVEAARPLIDRRGHRLNVSLPDGLPAVEVDPGRIEQVLVNLLNNAAKYTGDGGRIDVTAEAGDGEVVVQVRDTGVGIPPEMLPQIFETFTQVDHSRSRSEGGLGIGLTLVRRLVELHGGRVSAESEVGRGSVFTVCLPTRGRSSLQGATSGGS
ncbi:MAG: ATP-binding protein [Isosphaeraceae bacterium]